MTLVLPDAAVRSPLRAAQLASRWVLGGVLAIQLLVPGGWGGLAWVPLVVGLLVGLPHGAVDHLVPGFRLGHDLSRTLVVVVGYAGLAGLALLAFRAWPGPGLAVFVAVSVWHFGTGETACHALLRGARPARDVLGAITFGAVVLVLPITAHTDEVAPIMADLAPGSAGLLGPGVSAAVTAICGVLVAAAALARRDRPQELLDLGLLLAVAVLVPPTAAFGAYFGGWHAVRHTARLLAEDPASADDLVLGRLGRPLSRFARRAALPTAVALTGVGVLWLGADGWRGFVSTDLSVLAALTVPHLVVVAWMDRTAR